MFTRAAAAREATLSLAEMKSSEHSLSSPTTHIEENPRKRKAAALRSSRKWHGKVSLGDDNGEDAGEKAVGVNVPIFNTTRETNRANLLEGIKEEFPVSATDKDYPEIVLPTPPICIRKRRRVVSNVKKNGLVNGEVVSGGWDELPHNLGSVEKSEVITEHPVVTESEAARDHVVANDKAAIRGKVTPINAVTSKGQNLVTPNFSQDIKERVDKPLEIVGQPVKKVKKGKANPYGLTPGESPFPDFVMPTVEACKEVQDLLSEAHGRVEPPKEIPPPSLDVTGCGEVPSVLDAMIRTRLSASTTTTNAKYAFQGLVRQYGILKEGIGTGSVDWNKVRESDVTEIEKAIKRGGLARTKSISIKSILEMVHEINITRRDAFKKEKATGEIANVVGAERMTQAQKEMEIETAEKRILSLQFIHNLDSDKAMTEFVKFPGIGVKTASCIILFCLQRPSFAVDTHVHRFCRWMKWVPQNATRDQAFSHCEVRIPDEMKYSLHQLFIRHGKTCGRCRAATGEGSEEWIGTVCPIEHLVERTGKRKSAGLSKKDPVDKKQKRDKQSKKIGLKKGGSPEGYDAVMGEPRIEDENAHTDNWSEGEDIATDNSLSDTE
jgi:endonuclease III